MAITRAELGLGLLIGWLVTPRGKVIGEIRVPPTEIAKVEVASSKIGMPAIAIKNISTDQTEYQEICKIEVPEGAVLSLEHVSIYASSEEDYAVFKIEIGDAVVEGITLASSLVATCEFRGRVELSTGQKVAIYVKTSDVAHTVKGHGSINGVVL